MNQETMINDSSSSNSAVTVMIVEDHMVCRIGLKIVMEMDQGLEVVAEAGDGEQAILLAQQLQPDVIVMDVSMPILDGIGATKQIKALVAKSKVLMLTSHDGDNEVFSALSAGADGYCLKETPTGSICAAIKAVHSGAGWLDPAIAKKVIAVYTTPKVALSKQIVSKEADNFRLSTRQTEILELVVRGMSNQQMAEHLYVSSETIKSHMRSILEKLAVGDRTQAAVKAIRSGLVLLES
jgi:DNA-binding NarL/FixJ family response regulator